jgi:hypothetical protein
MKRLFGMGATRAQLVDNQFMYSMVKEPLLVSFQENKATVMAHVVSVNTNELPKELATSKGTKN